MEEMTFEQAQEWGKTLDFPKVWAALMENRRQIASLQETQKQTSQALKQFIKENEKLSKNVGGLNNSVGDIIEVLFASHVWEKFPEYHLTRAYRRLPIYDENSNDKGEIDLFLVNSNYAMAVEVKTEANENDILHHVKRMQLIRKYPPLQFHAAKLIGAIATGFAAQEVKQKAFDAGFCLLELSGENVNRVPEPKGFKPIEW